LNTYFRSVDGRRVYKTRDSNQRERLKRRGWTKYQRWEMDISYNRQAVKVLSKSHDGEYQYGYVAATFYYIGNPVGKEPIA
jgi:hypothetical protein